MRRRPSRAGRVRGAAILILDRRVRKLERAVFGDKRRIGFEATDVHGEVIDQDDDDVDPPDEVP